MRVETGRLRFVKRNAPLFSRVAIILVAILGLLIGCEQTVEEGREKNDSFASSRSAKVKNTFGVGIDAGVDAGMEDYVWIEKQKLMPTEGIQGSYFGLTGGMSGDTAVVGAFLDSENGKATGAVYVFVRSDDTWFLQQKLMPSDGESGDLFGYSASIDGDTMAVGAVQDVENEIMSGSVSVFVRSGDEWQLQQKILADDGEDEDGFGVSVVLDGDTLVVGADSDDDSAEDSGSVYVYVRNKDSWTLQQKIIADDGDTEDIYGGSLALSGDTLIVGAFLDDDGATDCGAAYIYQRLGDTWQEQDKLVPSDGADEDLFGIAVAVNGDTVLVGSPNNDENGYEAGAAYMYSRSGNTWTMDQKLLSSDGESPDLFGRIVALGDDIALVGAILGSGSTDETGSAYIYTRLDGTWEERQELLPSDGAYEDIFGVALAISEDTALIGSIFNDEGGIDAGAVYVFEISPPQGTGENCSIDIQCVSGFCVDGVCCEEECGGNNGLDCQACSEAAGSSEDGVCDPLDGTICDDGNVETFDDMCNLGECEGTVSAPDTDVDADTDSDSDTDGDADSDTEECEATGGGESDSCGCANVGIGDAPGLVQLFTHLIFDLGR